MLTWNKNSVLALVLIPIAIALIIWLSWDNLPAGLSQSVILAGGVSLILKYRSHAPLIVGLMLFLNSSLSSLFRGQFDLYNLFTAAALASFVGGTLWLYRAKGYVALLVPIAVILLSVAGILYLVWFGRAH